jgi:hypothetical protein
MIFTRTLTVLELTFARLPRPYASGDLGRAVPRARRGTDNTGFSVGGHSAAVLCSEPQSNLAGRKHVAEAGRQTARRRAAERARIVRASRGILEYKVLPRRPQRRRRRATALSNSDTGLAATGERLGGESAPEAAGLCAPRPRRRG